VTIYVGLDPSIVAFGVAVIERTASGYRLVHSVRIRTKSKDPIVDRCNRIFDGVGAVVREFRPLRVGCEEQRNVQTGRWREATQGKTAFNADNSKTILAVGYAGGAVRAYGHELVFFQPRTLKVAVMGKGGGMSSKEAVRARVIAICGGAGMSLDESDAAAAAIAVAQMGPRSLGMLPGVSA
jgi:Holliday junction resolvasome RuvABC endonuclease subunit